ncbi:MAG: transketolase [Acidobacteriaceae bacterium]
MSEIEQKAINALRFLAVDAVDKAKSGHPGAPLGDAPMAYLLFHKYMRHNPKDSHWPNRDRFVLSNGHASALLYGVLHLTGYDVTIDDLKGFRQWGSRTPGHPELGDTDGVEVTTGPLGQGFAMGVGMAVAERHLAARFNQPEFDVVDHYTYVMCSDGDLMEGVSHESASLAGTLGLGKLIALYDDNSISLDGPTELSFTEDVLKRCEAYHWHVQIVEDGNDLEGISKAIEAAKAVKNKPSMIAVRTIIGYGSPVAGTNKAHGEALGPEHTKATKKNLGWPEDKSFWVPEDAGKHWLEAIERGAKYEEEWKELFGRYKEGYPELGEEFERVIYKKALPDGWEKSLPTFAADAKPIATRSAGNTIMNAFAAKIPEFFGGAADLSTSTKTVIKDGGNFHLDPAGRNIYYGVREFGMCCLVNGMAVHGGVIPYGSTFFCFTDYCKPALRLAAIMKSHSIFVFTHDSIGLGEDGPTHQPIEHLMMLRAVPNLIDLRPADANETAAAWKIALEAKAPSFFALSRQDLPILDTTKLDVMAGVAKGAYIVEQGADAAEQLDLLIVGTGAEVWPALEAAKKLKDEGKKVRVISMPSWRLFEQQSQEYKDAIFPDHLPKLAVEAGAPLGWWKWVGRHGDVIGMDRFGASAPGTTVLEKLGFNAEGVYSRAKKLLERSQHETSASPRKGTVEPVGAR